MNPTVLVVDDEEQVRHSIAQWLELGGLAVETAADADAALAAIRRRAPEVVLTDFKMPRKSGMDLMRELQRFDPDIPVVLLTAHGDVPLAVAAMREGAYDFLQKPYVPEHLSAVVARAIEQRRLKQELQVLSERVAAHEGLQAHIVGASAEIARVRDMVGELCLHDPNVIITGQTGTGKEVVARALHDFGPRAKSPFVAINCAAVPEELFESELFGHEAGAFTGARTVRIGKFEFAHGGTLLLDEIESMPLPLQAKLLRVLQERVVERVGSNKSVAVNVRIIAATKYDLEEQVRLGRFRPDLYYRLAGAEIPLPPLKAREGDILLLFEHFARRAASIAGQQHRSLSSCDVEALLTHSWPGNVRELKSVAERHALGLKAMGRTVPEILGKVAQSSTVVGSALADRVAAYERRLIETALKDHGGSISSVIEVLGIPRRTLNEKMVKYGLIRPGRDAGAQRHA
ncbi:MAG: sigma-54-dependent Fis family transcriptional regulator [Gammaproteobacteria bacterium]|nr:sigma-54-dependent Fis family transcriptional regulator [Gammaproteobacteria bacterium]